MPTARWPAVHSGRAQPWEGSLAWQGMLGKLPQPRLMMGRNHGPVKPQEPARQPRVSGERTGVRAAGRCRA